MLLFGAENRRERNFAVEGDEPPAALYRQGKEVNVGDLFWAVNPPTIDDSLVQNTKTIRPEFVVRSCRRMCQPLDDFPCLYRVRVLRLGHDSNAPILRQRTRCPPGVNLSP